jgi:chitinase
VPVTVRYATANGTATAGSDYTAATGTLTFSAGSVRQEVAVSITGDATVESDETFSLLLSSPQGATLGQASALATITNDDAPPPPPPSDPGALPIASHDRVLAAYFPEWGIYGRNFQVADVAAEKLTHLIYSFLDLKSDGKVALFDSYAAVEKRFPAGETVSGEADLWYYPPGDPRATQTVWGNFNQLAQLKEKYPHLRVSIAVGGWTLSDHFSTVCATAAGRETFATSLVQFLETYRMFDGIDFDWEYPGGGGEGGNSASPADGQNYALLLATFRAKLDGLQARTGRRYEISVASPAGIEKIAAFNLAGLAPSVSFFNVMTYDFHGTWESTTGHLAAFTADPARYDIRSAVAAYAQAGVDPRKIVLGAPMYTRAWKGVVDGGDGGYAEKSSGAAPGSFEPGNYDYKDLLVKLQAAGSTWKLHWDDRAQAAYLYNGTEQIFSSFETPTSIAQKAQWASDSGLGGMMFWDISNDATASPESLLTAAYSSWVIDESFATIRARSRLTGEIIVGGDGLIAPLAKGW